MPDAVAFAHENIIRVGFSVDALLLKGVDGKGEVDVDVADSENESPYRNDRKSPELSNASLETESNPEKEWKQIKKEVNLLG